MEDELKGESSQIFGDSGMFTHFSSAFKAPKFSVSNNQSLTSLPLSSVQTRSMTAKVNSKTVTDLVMQDKIHQPVNYSPLNFCNSDKLVVDENDKFAVTDIMRKLTSTLDNQMAEQRKLLNEGLSALDNSVKKEVTILTNRCIEEVNNLAVSVKNGLFKCTRKLESMASDIIHVTQNVANVEARMTSVENHLVTEVSPQQHKLHQTNTHFQRELTHLESKCNKELFSMNQRITLLENKVQITTCNTYAQTNSADISQNLHWGQVPNPHDSFPRLIQCHNTTFKGETEPVSSSQNPYLHNLCKQISGVEPWRPQIKSCSKSRIPLVDNDSDGSSNVLSIQNNSHERNLARSVTPKSHAKTPNLLHTMCTPLTVYEHNSDSDSASSLNSTKSHFDSSEMPQRKTARAINRHIKLPEYDGTYDAGIFLRQVDKIVELTGWDETELCANLMSALKGPARDILACFPPKCSLTSTKIAKSISAKFGRQVHSDVARAKLADLKQLKGQSIKQLSLEVERLIGQAYGSIDDKTREFLAIDALLQAIFDADVRLQTRLNHPKTLSAAVLIAESVESAVRQSRGYAIRRVHFVSQIEETPEKEINESNGKTMGNKFKSKDNQQHKNAGEQYNSSRGSQTESQIVNEQARNEMRNGQANSTRSGRNYQNQPRNYFSTSLHNDSYASRQVSGNRQWSGHQGQSRQH
jgi:hypothetical protein